MGYEKAGDVRLGDASLTLRNKPRVFYVFSCSITLKIIA